MFASNFIVSLFKSFGLHIFIGVALVGSVAFKPPEKPKPIMVDINPIKSVSVDKDKLAAQVNKIKTAKANKKAAEEKRVRDLEARARKAKSKQNKAEDNLKDLNKKTRQSKADKRAADAAAAKAKAKQKREKKLADNLAAAAEKKRKEKARADKAAADAKKRRLAAEAAEKKAEADRKAKVKKAEEQRKRKAREERERREAELQMQKQMAEEQAARDRAHNKQVLGEVEKYKALIVQRINDSMIKDETMRGKSCRVKIRLAFNGVVTSAKILDGDPIVCQAAQSALYKADKLPMSKDPAAHEKLKDITLTFKPEI